jgi:hypothetical protein
MPLVTGTRWLRRSPTVSRVRRESPVVQHRLPLRHPLHGTVCLALKASRVFRPRRLSRAVAGPGRPFPALPPLLTHGKYNQTMSRRGLARCVRSVRGEAVEVLLQ